MQRITMNQAAKMLNIDVDVLSAGIRADKFQMFCYKLPNPNTKRGYSVVIYKELVDKFIRTVESKAI